MSPQQNSVSSHVDAGRQVGTASKQPGLRSTIHAFSFPRCQLHWNRAHGNPESLNLHLRVWKGPDEDSVPFRLDNRTNREVTRSVTKKHYKSEQTLLLAYAIELKLNPLQASLPLLIEFLEYVFSNFQVNIRTLKNQHSAITFHRKAGLSYTTQDDYHSAITFPWKAELSYTTPEDDPVITDISKHFYARCPFRRSI